MLDKRGNSNWKERTRLIDRFIRLFGAECIDSLVADREFVGKQWVEYLNNRRIRYYLRIKQNFWLRNPKSSKISDFIEGILLIYKNITTIKRT